MAQRVLLPLRRTTTSRHPRMSRAPDNPSSDAQLFEERRTMNIKTTLIATALATAGLALSTAHAGTSTATMPVTITIQNACNVSSVAPTTLNFGTQGPLTSAVNQTSTITVICTKSAPYNIGLDAGGSGNINARTMVNGSNTVTGTGTGSAQAYTVYGQVPAQTTPPAGVYNDTVNVTVTY